MKLFYKYLTIFFNFSPTSSHLHPLQVENCDSNSRLVVDKMTMVNSGLQGLLITEHMHWIKLTVDKHSPHINIFEG